MGRITVFTAEDVHSEIVKNELKRMSLPYTEISVIDFPLRRSDLKALTNKTSIPQIFFNTRHVGGVSATLEALQRWKKPSNISTSTSTKNSLSNNGTSFFSATSAPFQLYQAEIESMPDPTSKKLEPTPPRSSAEQQDSDTKRVLRPSIGLPDGTTTTVRNIMEKLKNTLPQGKHTYKSTIYMNTFTGKQAVETFQEHMAISQDRAIVFTQNLLDASILEHVRADELKNSNFHNSDKEVYCLQCYRHPRILNSYRIWNEQPARVPNAVDLVARLDNMLTIMERGSLNEHGKIDHDHLIYSTNFPQLDEAVCELQKVDLVNLRETERKAFAINLFRFMLRYAFIKKGMPANEAEHKTFMKNMQFYVGCNLFSLQEWLDGILRANTPVNSSKKEPFGRLDARRKYALKHRDYKIHFALYAGCCLNSTCSLPFRQFSSDNLEAELDEAARAYCDDESFVAVNVNENPMSVRLSKIFCRYRSDFPGKNDATLLEIICAYAEGYKKVDMKKIVSAIKSIEISYKNDSWDMNSCNWPVHRKDQIQSKVKKGIIARVTRRFVPPKNPQNERIRLQSLRNLNLLDTFSEERFDCITRMVKEAFDVPIVLISLVDENRQWFKSTQWACPLAVPTETGRDISFCGHAINNGDNDILLIKNALEDDRFADNPLVTGPVSIRFYAGYALSVPSVDGGPNVNIGTLCLIDQKPRDLSDSQLEQLRHFGGMVEHEITRRDRESSHPTTSVPSPVMQRKALHRANSDTSLESASS